MTKEKEGILSKEIKDVAMWLITKVNFQMTLCKCLGGRGEVWGCREQYRGEYKGQERRGLFLLEGAASWPNR